LELTEDTLCPGLQLQISVAPNKTVLDKQQFLETIDGMCKVDDSSITKVTCDEEFTQLLKQPFKKAVLWRKYTQDHPLHGLPSSIPDLLQELRLIGIKELDVYNYAATKTNYPKTLNELIEHFAAPPGTRDPLNCLDIRNLFISRVPAHINDADFLRLSRRRHGSSARASKAKKMRSMLDFADREFLLASSQNSISTLHGDTAGGLTYIIVLSGRKTWYLPRLFDRESSEILATFGSSTPEAYDEFIKIDLRPGDLL
jgi:hypothetical protein